MSGQGTARERITQELKDGPRTVEQLTEALELKEPTIRQTLWRMTGRGEVTRTARLQEEGGLLFSLVEE